MSYPLIALWHDRQRFLPAILAVSFSLVLIVLQGGLLLGMFSTVTIPIDRSRADVWAGYPGVLSIDLTRPVPAEWESRLASQPEVIATELYLQGHIFWARPAGGVEMCSMIGTAIEPGSFGPVQELSPALRLKLTELGSIVVDEAEKGRLGINKVGEVHEVMGCRLRVVGFVRGLKGLAGAYLFCSLDTARLLLGRIGLRSDQATWVLARCRGSAEAEAVVRRLQGYREMSIFTRDKLSLRSRMHWLTMTKAGLSLGCAALLGLLVGAGVTSQTLYAATAGAAREFAVLEALGIPTWRIVSMVLTQSLVVGLLGIGCAFPAIFATAAVFDALGSKPLLPSWLIGIAVVVTLGMALASGVVALRSLRLAEPTSLLR
jgi:putative ABC transport system permease protein